MNEKWGGEYGNKCERVNDAQNIIVKRKIIIIKISRKVKENINRLEK